MEEHRRRGWFGYSLRGLALFIVGLSIGLAVGLHYSPFRKMAPNEAFAYKLPAYVVEPPDVLAIDVIHPSHPEADFSTSCRVGPDGKIQPGQLGSMYVTGLTLKEVSRLVQKAASGTDPDVHAVVNVSNYNSKKYYIITQGPGFGDNIVTAPITGNDTVLDALAATGYRLDTTVQNIWISRPHATGGQILPVDYEAITTGADPLSNYQLLPGDRLFMSAKPVPKN